MEWLFLIIPICALIILNKFFNKEVVWWEYLLPLAISVIIIFTTKYIISNSLTSDTEYYGEYAISMAYFEEWNEEVSCSHPIYVTTTDSKGNTTRTLVGYEHAYDVSYHSPNWEAYTNANNTYSISEGEFNYYSHVWKSRKFVDLNRDYHDIDGDEYLAQFDTNFDHLRPFITEHSYENKVIASTSIFNYETPDTSYHLFEYPEVTTNYYLPSIMSDNNNIIPNFTYANERLTKFNGLIGNNKQARIWLLIYINKSEDYAWAQEQKWQGGNKNEFVVTIGINNDNHIQWSKVFSWTPKEELKINVRNYFFDNDSLDIIKAVDTVYQMVNTDFKRRNFSEFNYLSVDLKLWHYLLIGLFTTLVTIGVSIFVIKNEYEN
jgi:hypothetical protein